MENGEIIQINNIWYKLSNDKIQKGDRFLILCEDESYGEVEISDIEDFNNYADEKWIKECFKIIGSTVALHGVPLIEVPKDKVESSKIKCFLTTKDMQDGTVDVALFSTRELALKNLGVTEEEIEEDSHETGTIAEVSIEIGTDSAKLVLLKGFKENLYI